MEIDFMKSYQEATDVYVMHSDSNMAFAHAIAGHTLRECPDGDQCLEVDL